MSGFVHNLARRGAGLDPMTPVRPPFVPSFALGAPTRMRLPAPSLVGDSPEMREPLPPTASSRNYASESGRETDRETSSTRVSASGQESSTADPALPPHPPVADSEPSDSSSPVLDQRTDGQPSDQRSRSLPAGPVGSSRIISPLHDAQERYAPPTRVRATRQTEEGSGSEPADEIPPGSPIGPSPEGRAVFEPGPAPAMQSPSSGSGGSIRTRVASSVEATEQYAPAVRTTAARNLLGGSSPALAATVKPDRPPQDGEPATEVEPGAPPVRTVQPPSGESASTGQPPPGPLAQVEPAPVSSSVATRQASVIRPEPAQPAELAPLLRRPTAQPEQDSIHVRIGTVEVRASVPPPAPPPAPLHQGFEDYAMIRSYVGWERR